MFTLRTLIQPTLSPTTVEPTLSPSDSPTLSMPPSKSLDDCLRDPFGVERIFASGSNSDNNWYSRWMKSRTIPSSTPFEVDQFDGRTSVSGNGVVTIENGVASLQRSPKIQIYAGAEGWGSVEMTGYATYLSGGVKRSSSGFNMVIQMTHPSDDKRCAMPSYRAHISLNGVASFQKEYRPEVRTRLVRTDIDVFNRELPLDVSVGVKFIVRRVGQDQVDLQLYIDTEGGDQDWMLVHSYTDFTGSWKASGDDIPQDECSSSLEDGSVLQGKTVYAELFNVGNVLTFVEWRDVSVRSINRDTSMFLACTSVSPSLTPTTTSPTIKETSQPSAAVISVHPSVPPSIDSNTTVWGLLQFNLPLTQLLEDSDAIAVFEQMVEDLLQKKLDSRVDSDTNTTIEFFDYNVNIEAQTLVEQQPDVADNNTSPLCRIDPSHISCTTTNDTEPIRKRKLQTSTSLIVDASVTAVATPGKSSIVYV